MQIGSFAYTKVVLKDLEDKWVYFRGLHELWQYNKIHDASEEGNCETRNTVNPRNIYGMLLCIKEMC